MGFDTGLNSVSIEKPKVMYVMNFDPATTNIQTLVVRSDSSPVDWTSQIQINEREYDKAYIQLSPKW